MTIIYFILILGLIVFVHELGHFIFAKRAGIYCYEFALGMGPKLFSFNRKNDETLYSVRLFPIGGYVRMAGEDDDEEEKVSKDKHLTSKSFTQRFLTIFSGALFNFILGILLLFLIGIIYGSQENRAIFGAVDENYSAYKMGIREGDLILKIDDKKVKYWNDVLIYFETIESGSEIVFNIKDSDGNIKNISVVPTLETIDGEDQYIYGFTGSSNIERGLFVSIKYAFTQFISTIKTMFNVFGNLITGKLSVESLTGPVGIYSIVDEQSSGSFSNIMYLISLLSINVGFINLIPFPAFDGGRLFLLVLEKIRRKPINRKIENAINAVGLFVLFGLMILITIKDVAVIIK
ncbi:MAG: RIP metalloprotease RseP [Bacilli bacterium]|nr:RIP metalloprotease RseP [Bacilli bacterium]